MQLTRYGTRDPRSTRLSSNANISVCPGSLFSPLIRNGTSLVIIQADWPCRKPVRVFREKPSEKFSRPVPKFALASVTSITIPPHHRLTSHPLSQSLELTCAVHVETTNGGETTGSAHCNPTRDVIPHQALSCDLPLPLHRVSLARPFVTFPYRLAVPPPPPQAEKLHGFSLGRRVAPSSFAPSSVSETPNASQCCQIRESFSTATGPP